MLVNIFQVVISIPKNFIPLSNTYRRRDIHTGDTSFKNILSSMLKNHTIIQHFVGFYTTIVKQCILYTNLIIRLREFTHVLCHYSV